MKRESANDGNFYCSPTFNTLRNSFDVSADQYELSRGSSDTKQPSPSKSSAQPHSGSGQPGSIISLGAQTPNFDVLAAAFTRPTQDADDALTKADNTMMSGGGSTKVRREISFHEKSDLFAVRQRE